MNQYINSESKIISDSNTKQRSHVSKWSYVKQIVFIIMISLIRQTNQFLYIDSLQISALTNYTVQLVQFTTAPAGSIIQLQLPTQYSADDLRARVPYSGDPFDGSCPIDCTSVAISYSGFIFNITGMFPSAQFIIFKYSIKNVPNPRTALTISGYTIRVIDPSQNVIFTQSPASRTFVPKTMLCTASSTDFNAINFISTGYFQINPTTNPSDSPLALIMVQFPSTWATQPLITSTLTTDVYCLSISQPQIRCQRSSQVINLLNVSYSASIDFEIHSLQSPSLTLNAGVITISTMTRSRVKLDSCSVSVTSFKQNFLRIPSLQIVYTSNTYLQATMSVTFPTKVAAGTIVHYTFASSLSLDNSSCKAYLAGTLLSSVNPTYISANNTVIINPFTSLIFKPNIQITCTNIKRPRAASTLGNVTVNSFYNNFLVASISCCSTILKGRASLSVQSVVTDKPFLQTSNAQYIISLTTSMSLLTTDMIYVYFPKQFSLGSGSKTCSISSSSAAVASPTCTIMNGNLIKAYPFITVATSGSADFTLTINSIQNPTKNPSFTPFKIYIVNQLQEIIEYNETACVTISAALINTFTVTAVNRQVLYTPSQYNVDFISNGIIGANYYIVIKFPTTVTIDQASLKCTIASQQYPCWYNSLSNLVQVRIITTLASSTVSLIIYGCINPESLAPTGNFNLQIMDPTSNIIQISSVLLSVTVTMNSTQQFKNLYSFMNLSQNSYPSIHSTNLLQIVATSPTTVKSSHKMTISYNNSQILFNAGSQTSQCISPFVCTFDSVNYVITVTNIASTPNTDTVYLNISNCIALITKPKLTIELLNSANYKILSSVTTNSPNMPDLISYNISQTSWQYAAITDVTITYSISALASSSPSLSSVTRISYLLVNVPAQYTTSASNNIYNFTTFNGQLVIAAVTNPSYSQFTSSFFYITAYDANSDIIAVSINNKRFSAICQMPCKTCQSGSTSNCINCYSWHSLNIFYINLSTNQSTCLSQCPQYYYQDNVTLSCKSCDPNCKQCDKYISNKCVSCPVNNYLHENNFMCYADCPTGYYENYTFCRACTSNCLTCLNQTFCYTCATGNYFYANKCITACPPSTYTITTPLSCVNCPTSNCLHCNQTECLACIQSYYLYNKQCYTSCPTPLLPTISRICKNCQCATCNTYANNCTSCLSTSPYLYNNYCYKACPLGMYPGALNVCSSCPLSCAACTNYLVCTLCKQTYAIMTYSANNVSCISQSTCPSGTILTLSTQNKPICLACTSPCATCEITTTFCLSCISSYNLHNNTCVLVCPVPYHSILNKCQKCISVCLLCTSSDPQNCTECQANYFLYNSTCYTSCPIGTYEDIQNKQCASCNPLCRTCSNATNCTSCNSGFLYSWFCYTTCPTTPIYYYQYNGVCTPCQPQCVTCINSPIQCTSCSNPNYLYNMITHECIFQCVSPYFKNGSYCVACQSPCLTCDTTFNSCSTCLNSLYMYNGTCVATCPNGYFGNSTSLKCEQCKYPCKLCVQEYCQLCQSFSYMYQNTCVLTCPDIMPYQQPGYCSECIGIGFCARCGSSSSTSQQICTQCVYPYVLFDQTCLNSCPENYTVVTSSENNGRICTKSEQYLKYLQYLQIFNRPILPPFFFLVVYLLTILILGVVSHKVYRFTYHAGYMIGVLSIADAMFSYYSLYYIYTRYQGQYVPIIPLLPFILICVPIICNYFILSIAFWLVVLKSNYLNDTRYIEWKQRNKIYWWVSTICIILLGGPRFHKLNYSKLFGIDKFSFRIVSVQKFFQQDIVSLFHSVGDLIQISSGFICVYNVFLGYNGLMFIGYQTFTIKIIMWILIIYDLKKPDRGFFIGDQEKAQQQMLKELQQQAKKLNRVDTENFVKLVRTKSAELIRNKKYFGDLDIDDFISVYNPDDYQEVIKVPNKKIQKNIYKGKYRRGRKITIQQKLNKFVDSIKPRPKVDKEKTDAYLWKLIYWKPPNFKKIKPKQNFPPSQQSFLKLLQQKEEQYKEQLQAIQLIEEQKQQPKRYYTKARYDQRTFLDDLDQTIPNDTVQFFYPPHSIDTNQKQNSLDFDDLLNLNYARKRHLQKKQQQSSLKQQSKRKLHHEPQKKRRNLRDFGQMVLKKQY